MKRLLKIAVSLSLVVGMVLDLPAVQTCQRSDFLCFESGPSQNLLTPFRVDSAGNMTVGGTTSVTGAQTLTGSVIYPPLGAPVISTGTNSSTVFLSTCSTINPISTVLVVVSTGANINMAGCQQVVPAPVIATATATAGQWLILVSTSQLTVGGSVTISSSAVNGLHLGSATRALSQNSVLTLIFDGVQHIWKEVSFTGE